MNAVIILSLLVAVTMATSPPVVPDPQPGLGDLEENRACHNPTFGGCDPAGGVCWYQKDTAGKDLHFCVCNSDCYEGEKCEIKKDTYSCMNA